MWEDNLLERKVESDLKDLLKTMTAFSNSVKPNHTAVILIGEKDDETIVGVENGDNIQKKVREAADKIYPAILWRSSVYEKEGKQCVRVEIEYSGDTPHFGGPSWIRKGSETKKASDEMFQALIDVRSEPIRELSKWVGKDVTVCGETAKVPRPIKLVEPSDHMPFEATHHVFHHRWPSNDTVARLLFVNRFWITLKKIDGEELSEPINKLCLTYDNHRNQLKILVEY